MYTTIMPKSKRKSKVPPSDPNRAAKSVLDAIIASSETEPEKNPAAVALGRLGGKKGGPARAKKLSAARRAEIAKKAANSRWKK